MNADNQKDALETSTRQVFEASVEGLDGATRSRLSRARAAAVEAAEGARHGARFGFRFGGLKFAGAAAAVALAIVIAWQPSLVGTNDAQQSAFDDLDILLDEEELDLFEELEFYAWLEEQPELEGLPEDPDGTG
jgi:hypothetical protein